MRPVWTAFMWCVDFLYVACGLFMWPVHFLHVAFGLLLKVCDPIEIQTHVFITALKLQIYM